MSEFTQKIHDDFNKDGLLSKRPEFEYRSQQQEMAQLIAESVESGKHRLIEAPTGIGKTYAYLVPSILHAKSSQMKAVISTRTINLQEQLIKKDIPAIREVLPVEFTSHILKGRTNYICTKRLSRAMKDADGLFDTEQTKILKQIYNFVQKEDKGELQDLNFNKNDTVFNEVWSSIYAEQDVCTCKSCGGEDTNCYFQRAKKLAEDADLIVLNHSLFFTLFGINEKKGPGYLFANDFVIFDEAHTIEQIAADNVADEVSRETVNFWLRKMFNLRKRKGFYDESKHHDVIHAIERVSNENEYFFNILLNEVHERYQSKRNRSEIRITEQLNIASDFQKRLIDLINEINKSKRLAKTDDEENEIRNFAKRFGLIKNTVDNFLNQTLNDYVYWVTASQSGRKNIVLKMSPIDMAEYFRTNIFVPERNCIMTSATLSIGDEMNFFSKSIGADEVEKTILDSSFDYERQMKIIIDEQMPLPEKRDPKNVSEMFEATSYEKALKEKVYEYILKTNGGVLVLFTSYKMMNETSLYLKEKLHDSKLNIFVQGQHTSANELLKKFKDDENSVLLGVDSFWMGIDVQGDSLRNVIITKLPFEQPDTPILEAKMELIEKRGGNAFMDYSLPTAILKFKQGIGRLIRSKTDEGMVVILDKRIISTRYGKYFISALPHQNIIMEGETFQSV